MNFDLVQKYEKLTERRMNHKHPIRIIGILKKWILETIY